MFSEFMFSKANLCNKNGPLVSNIGVYYVDFRIACKHGIVSIYLKKSGSAPYLSQGSAFCPTRPQEAYMEPALIL